MTQSLTNAACGLRVVDIETPQCLIQEHRSFSVTDLPVIEWLSSTTHSMYVLVINKLDHEASVPDLAVAMEEGTDGSEWQLLGLFTFRRRTKIADVKEGCGDCRILTLARLKSPTTARVAHHLAIVCNTDLAAAPRIGQHSLRAHVARAKMMVITPMTFITRAVECTLGAQNVSY
eukprot:5548840-Amphidinium_carterae.3